MTHKPILVMMSYRGGARLERCLRSIAEGEAYFSRIVLSITGTYDSADMQMCMNFQKFTLPRAEVICTEVELPTMQHQAFWVDHLENTGVKADDWIYWLAYDDEIFSPGISSIINQDGDWPLQRGSAYFGPWAMRHELADQLWERNPSEALEYWTSFPANGPTKLSVLAWIRQQFMQPTYIQMSGSINSFESFVALRDQRPRKQGPMRIEMATACTPNTRFVEEFSRPVSIIYGRPNSDRVNYAKTARKEDLHLMAWSFRYGLASPRAFPKVLELWSTTMFSWILRKARCKPLQEEWRIRGVFTQFE